MYKKLIINLIFGFCLFILDFLCYLCIAFLDFRQKIIEEYYGGLENPILSILKILLKKWKNFNFQVSFVQI